MVETEIVEKIKDFVYGVSAKTANTLNGKKHAGELWGISKKMDNGFNKGMILFSNKTCEVK